MDAFVVVYAIDDDSTFDFAKRVLQALRESIRDNSLPPAGFILVGNKSDLVRGREVPTDGLCLRALLFLIAVLIISCHSPLEWQYLINENSFSFATFPKV